MEPEHGRAVTGNTIQSNHDGGNPFLNLNNQVNTNSELLQISPAPGDGNAPHVVPNQAETLTLAASCPPKSPSSYGSPFGPDSDDPSVSLLPGPEGRGVQSTTIEPVSAANFSAEAYPGSMMSASQDRGPRYLIQDSMLTEDVDWRNPNQSLFSSPPSQKVVHEDVYDPKRIPSSVFRTMSTSPMDWSVASNESLFSIYTGNSFSGYPGMFKSGELGRIEELSPQNPFETFEANANDGRNFSPNLPALPETCPDDERQHGGKTEDDIRIQDIEDVFRIQESSSKNLTYMTEESKVTHGNEAFHEENMAVPSKNLTDMTEESKENHGDEANREENMAASSKYLTDMTEESKENHGNEANREENMAASSKNLTDTREETKENHGNEANREENMAVSSKNLTDMTEESKENHGNEANHEENMAASSKNLTDMTEDSKENHGNEAFHEENMAAPLISANKGEVLPSERTNSRKNSLSNDSARSCSPDRRLSDGSTGSKNRLSNESAGSFAFPVLVTEFSKSSSSKSSSFRMKSDKKDEAQKVQQEQEQEQEPPKTTPGATATDRGCMSCFPSWLRCV